MKSNVDKRQGEDGEGLFTSRAVRRHPGEDFALDSSLLCCFPVKERTLCFAMTCGVT